MHQIRSVGVPPQTPAAEGANTDTLAVYKGPTSKGRKGTGRGCEEKRGRIGKGEEKGRTVKGGIWPTQKFWRGAPGSCLVLLYLYNYYLISVIKSIDCSGGSSYGRTGQPPRPRLIDQTEGWSTSDRGCAKQPASDTGANFRYNY